MNFLNLVVVPVIINGGISEEGKELMFLLFIQIPLVAAGFMGFFKMGCYCFKLIQRLFLKFKNIIKNKK